MKMIRKPIITVLGHVDHGKTRLLDQIRGTAIADKEAGMITQHIGATEVPISIIEKIAGRLMKKYGFEVNFPGLLFIDTPGHEAFANLRKRGGSIADLAVVVIDITQLCQPQTYEALEVLRSFKTPFVIAANKTDKIFEWESRNGEFSKNLQAQSEKAKEVLDEKIYQLVGQLHEKGFQSERFDRCDDFSKQVPIVPISAKVGEGIPELLMLLAGLSQKFLEKTLTVESTENTKGTILEINEEKGLGKTIDVILYEGVIKVGDTIVLGGRNGVIETKIRALLQPKPLEEIRDPKEKFKSVKEVSAAAGLKIAAPNLDDAIAGSPIMVVKTGKEAQAVLEEISSAKIEQDALGPIVKSDALGSLEAFVMLLAKENLKVKKADVGDVTRKDVMEIIPVSEKEPFSGVIFAFNVKVNAAAEDEAQKAGIKIFTGNVIYKLIEDYQEWANEQRELRKKEKLAKVVLPVKFTVLPDFVFRKSKPAIVGVKIDEGKLRSGIKVMKENGEILGTVGAVQEKGKSVKEAGKGSEVAVSIDKATIGRNLSEKDVLYAYIPKNHFSELENLAGLFSAEEKKLIDKIKEMEKNGENEIEVSA